VLRKAVEDLHKHRREVARRQRIEQRADLIVTGKRRDAKQRLGVIVPFGVWQAALAL
jgi:hypothetical protein